MIKHIVIWKLAGDDAAKKATFEEFKKDTDHLREIIPEVKDLKVGLNTNGGAYQLVLDGIFANEADLNTYANHPEHVAMKNSMKGKMTDRIAVEYEF